MPTIRRRHLFELADEAWLPTVLKDGVTDNLQLGLNLLRPYRVVAPHVAELVQRMEADDVLDLGSGASGPWLSLLPELDAQGCTPRVILSDLQPSSQREASVQGSDGRVEYWPWPTDARDIPEDLRPIQVRTMFTALHHLREDDVRALLSCCVRDGVGFGAFEFTERRPRDVLLASITALLSTVVMSPVLWKGWSLRGLSTWLSRILLSPLVGVINAWDGAVSVLRTYTPAELQALVSSVPGAGAYTWRMGHEPVPGLSSRVTYLVGWPVEAA